MRKMRNALGTKLISFEISWIWLALARTSDMSIALPKKKKSDDDIIKCY